MGRGRRTNQLAFGGNPEAEFFGRVWSGSRNSRLDFAGYSDHIPRSELFKNFLFTIVNSRDSQE